MKSGERVFIQAGAGGIGTFVIQLAKHLGAYVVTTTSSRNVKFVKSLGADEVIDYTKQDFEKVLNNVDIVFDALGGDSLYEAFPVVRKGGWIVSISGDPNERLAVDMGLGFFKRMVLSIVGRRVNRLAKKFQINYRFIFMKASGQQLTQIAELIEKGRIKPIIDKEFSFSDCQKAIEHLELGRSRGKVVINIRD